MDQADPASRLTDGTRLMHGKNLGRFTVAISRLRREAAIAAWSFTVGQDRAGRELKLTCPNTFSTCTGSVSAYDFIVTEPSNVTVLKLISRPKTQLIFISILSYHISKFINIVYYLIAIKLLPKNQLTLV
jgi:hypothetical protein